MVIFADSEFLIIMLIIDVFIINISILSVWLISSFIYLKHFNITPFIFHRLDFTSQPIRLLLLNAFEFSFLGILDLFF